MQKSTGYIVAFDIEIAEVDYLEASIDSEAALSYFQVVRRRYRRFTGQTTPHLLSFRAFFQPYSGAPLFWFTGFNQVIPVRSTHMIRMFWDPGDIDPDLQVSGGTFSQCSLCFQSCPWVGLVQQTRIETQQIKAQIQSLLIVICYFISTSTASINSSTWMKTCIQNQNLAPIKKWARKPYTSISVRGWLYATLTPPIEGSESKRAHKTYEHEWESGMNPYNFLYHTEKCIWISLYQNNGAMAFEKLDISAW